MILKTVLIMLLTISVHSQCTDGCLKCVQKTCQYCDLQSGFRLVGQKCEKFALENCEFANNLGTCLKCSADYHLDLSTKKCIKILTQNLIENCATYNSPNSCLYCKAGFFLENGKCVQISAPIENCQIENSQQICLLCKPEHVLSIDQKICAVDPKETNCATYKNVQCESCKPGYIYNPNSYLQNLLTLATSKQQQDFLFYNNDLASKVIDTKKFSTCVQTKVPNCIQFKRFDFCEVCTQGHFLTIEGQCQENPKDAILHCEEYSSLTTCSQCQQGFWLDDKNQCRRIKEIEHCEQYSGEPLKSNCVRCHETHFLIGLNNCVPRDKLEIENCQKLNSNSETCEECLNTFKLTDDRSQCLQSISDCEVYKSSNYLTKQLRCKVCKDGFYYNEAEQFCVRGDREFCKVYQRDTPHCAVCDNKYYLEDGICLPHDVIPQCEVYHPRVKNVCFRCNYETFLFHKVNSCEQTEDIPNCEVYKNKNTCVKCIDNYFLQDNICELIPASENCVRRSGSQCGRCLKDFVLQDGVCRDPLDYIVNECGQDNIDGVTNYRQQKCKFCKEQRVPFNYKNTYVCVENDYMQLQQNVQNLDNLCLQFTADKNNKFSCAKCQFPNVVLDGRCVTSCPPTHTLYKQILKQLNANADRVNESFQVDRVNQCGDLIPYCKVAAPDLNQVNPDRVSYTCVECDTNSLPLVEFSDKQNRVLIEDPHDEKIQYGKSPVSYNPPTTCVPSQQTTVIGEVNNFNMVDNCQYYQNLGIVKGCVKCHHGYTGVVLDLVNQCEVYTNDQYTCKQCKDNFYLASPYECKPVQEVLNCLNYSKTSNTTKCIECQGGYFVASDTFCSLRNQSRDKPNCNPVANADACVCEANFFNSNTNGGYTCEQKPSYCLQASKVDNQIGCVLCDETRSFKQGTVCVAGSIDQCVQYKEDQSYCLKCSNQYFVKDGVCVQHATLNQCNTYSQTNKNTCTSCDKYSVLFNYQTRCVRFDTIDNCEEYDSTTTCLRCEENYRLENLRKRCLPIATDQNCLIQKPIDIFNSDQNVKIDKLDAMNQTTFIYDCNKCKNNFLKLSKQETFITGTQIELDGVQVTHPKSGQQFEVNVCVNYQASLLANCSKSVVDGTRDFQQDTNNGECLECATTAQLENLADDKHVCLDKGYFEIVQDDLDVENCDMLHYETVNGQKRYKCARCNLGFYQAETNANGTNTCSNECTANDTVKVVGHIEKDGNNKWTVSAMDRKCKDSTQNFPVHNVDPDANANTDVITNCETYSRYLGQDNKLTCVKCKDGYFPVMRIADDVTTLVTEESKVQENPFGVQLGFSQCVKKGDSNYNQVGTFVNNEVSGCKYYGIDVHNTIKSVYCFRCQIGMSGPIKTRQPDANDGAYKFTYIESCGAIANCSTTSLNQVATYGIGLQHPTTAQNSGSLMKYFTCFECTDPNSIPMLHIKLNPDGKILEYKEYNAEKDDGNNYELESAPTPGHAVACRNVYKQDVDNNTIQITAQGDLTGYKVVFQAATPIVPLNCAIGVINTGSVGDIATIVSTAWGKQVGCLACKPGFAPVQATAPAANAPTPVDSCEAIANCTSAGSYMNGCEQCVHYYDYNVVDGSAINYSKCVPLRPNDGVTLAQCFAAYSVGKCQVCQPGYAKNDKGMCVHIEANFCDSTYYAHDQAQLTLFNGKAATPVSLMMYLLRHNEVKGCNKCSAANDKLVLLNKVEDDRDKNLPNLICTKNPLNTLREDQEHCTNFGWDSQKQESKCVTCHSDYVLTTKHECSLKSDSNMTNCKLLNEMKGTTCLECEDDYLIVGGLCELKSAAVQNCEEYDEDQSKFGSVAVCTRCSSGNYLQTPSKCAQNPILQCAIYDKDNKNCVKCQQGYQKIVKKNGEQFCYQVVASSNDDNQDQCAEWDNDEFQKKNLKCLKCKYNEGASSYLVANTDVKMKTECIKFSSLDNTQLDALNCIKFDIKPLEDAAAPNQFAENTFRCLECTQDQSDDVHKVYYYDRATAECKTRVQVQNCKRHAKEKDVCVECVDNFVLKDNECEPLVIADVSVLPKNFGYIQSCSLMNTCDNKIRYEGLNVHVQTLASCHKCIDQNQIPFIAARTSDNLNTIEALQEYGFVSDINNQFISESGEKAVQCLNPVKGTFNVSNDADFVFPANCGMGMINVKEVSKNNALASTNEKHGVYCVACQPKFKPTYTQTFNYYVQSCASISNCESSTWFNNCSQCMPGYSYGYDMGVKYDECVQYQDNTNCYAVEVVGNVKRCKVCRAGYVLNVDGFCEGIIAPRCGYGKFDFRRHYELHDLPVQLVLQGDGPGCQQCDDGFVGLFKDQDTVACTASPYHTDDKVTQDSKYLYKCKNYKVTKTGRLECEICQEDFVLGIRGKCYPKTNLQNCRLALNDSKCRDCLEGFVNVDRSCVQGDIDKCKVYGNADQSFEQICVRCDNGFFLRDNKCVEGQVSNCEQFVNEKQCMKCKPQFGLMKIHKGESYCFPIHESMKCKEVSDMHLQVGVFQCERCVNNIQVLLHDPMDIQTTTCMPFIKTENCSRYNKTDSLMQTTFDCVECSQDYYLSNGRCVERVVKHMNCIEYALDKDECLNCANKYFLSDDAKSCLPYPEGTPNCQVYLSHTECLVCKNGFFLRNKVCVAIPEDMVIAHCLLYEDLSVCAQCEEGHLLLDGICVKSNATGCRTFKTINSCATCPNGSGFVQEGNLLNCVAQTVANCLEIDPYEPYPCLKCENGFFLQDAKCNAVSQTIENCLTYSDNGVCMSCEVGFALTADKTTCLQNAMLVSLLDPYCQDSKIKEQPVCNTCQFGHVFKHGYCLPCSANTLEEGCLNCNPSNQDKCLICRQGYYQHSNGKCYKNGEVPPEEKPIDDNEPTTPTDGPTDGNDDSESDLHKLAMAQILTYLIWVFII